MRRVSISSDGLPYPGPYQSHLSSHQRLTAKQVSVWPTATRSATTSSQRRMYYAGVRLWPCQRPLVARALSLRTPALDVNTPPCSPFLREIPSSRSLSVTLAAPSRRPFGTAPPVDPSPHGASREGDIGKDKERRPTSTGTTRAQGTRSTGDDRGEECSSAAAEVGGKNELKNAASSSSFAASEKLHQLHPATGQDKNQQPDRSNTKTKRPPLSSRAVAMMEFAALERKLAARSAPPTAGRSLEVEVTAHNSSSSSSSSNRSTSSNGNGNGNVINSSSSNGSKEKRKTAEQVAMEEFAALERKLGSAGGGSQGPKERAVSISPSLSAAAIVARPKEPAAEECCGNGCANCVWIDYWEELQTWEGQEREREREKAPP